MWFRVGLGVLLSVGAFSLIAPPRVLGEGSADLEANGGKRALTEWRTSLYGNLLPRRNLFKVYAQAGEEIALGSSGVGVGAGDIVVWTPGQITSPLTVALPAPAFTCSAAQPGLGAMTTRTQEVAGPAPAAGGYTPCIYTAATTGVYNVALYGPSGGTSDVDGTAGTVAAPAIDATQASGVSMWDITVRSIASPGTPINGRVYVDYLAQITGGNGAANRVQSTVWAVTNDGFQYRIDLRGLDPNGFILYGNTVGFLDPDGVTPLYHDLVADTNPLSGIQGGVLLSPPTGLLFFAQPAADLPSSIVPTPVEPTVNSITFQGTAGLVSGVPGSVVGTGGNIVFDGNIGGVAHVVIAPNPGAGGCAAADFDPSLPTNRSLVRVVAAGVQNLPWDGTDNSGTPMPASWTGNGGPGYCFGATLHAGEYHFPLLDAENSRLGGPTITLLNPPGGACPFASCSTAFFDDRGYQTSIGATVGTVGAVLLGNNPPPAPAFSDAGFDTASTTIRAYGDDTAAGFGNQKGLDLWTYFPSEDVTGPLVIVPQGASDLSITKTHVGDFTVGVNGVYTLAVRNVGSGNIGGVITVTDTVPAGLDLVSAAGSGWACGTAGSTVTCTVTPAGGLASGASLPDITVTVNPTPAAVPSVTNTATVSNTNDVNPDNDTSSSVTGISPAAVVADLAVAKTDGVSAVTAGGTTTYTITVTNNGPDPVSGAILADPAVAGLAKTAVACAAAPGQCTGPTTPSVAELEGGTFALPALASGQTYAISVSADVTAASGTVANTATVAAPAGTSDPAAGNDSATDTDTVSPAAVVADLAVAKTDGVSAVTAGGTTTYTITVTNNGPDPVSGAILADPAVAGLAKTAVACAAAPGQCTGPTTPSVAELEGGTFALPALASGQTYAISVSADVTAASGTVANTATVAAPAGTSDPAAGNDSATDTDTVSPAAVVADLAVAKTDGVSAVTAGGTTTYTITVTNNGPDPVSGAILADPAVAGLAKTAVACAAAPGQCTGPTTPSVAELEGGTFALPALASGQTYAISVSADVTAASGTVANTATVAAPAGTSDPAAGNDSATDTDTVSPAGEPTPTPTPLPVASPSLGTPPPTDLPTTADTLVPGISLIIVLGIAAGVLAGISLYASGRTRRRR